MVLDSTLGLKYFISLSRFLLRTRVSGLRKKPEVISVPAKGTLMKRNNIWLFILSPLLVLTGVPANAGIINLSDLLPGTWTLQSTNFLDPLPLGDGSIPGSGIAGSS